MLQGLTGTTYAVCHILKGITPVSYLIQLRYKIVSEQHKSHVFRTLKRRFVNKPVLISLFVSDLVKWIVHLADSIKDI